MYRAAIIPTVQCTSEDGPYYTVQLWWLLASCIRTYIHITTHIVVVVQVFVISAGHMYVCTDVRIACIRCIYCILFCSD